MSTEVSTQRTVDLKSLSLTDVKDIGQVFVQSGMFKDTKTTAQAVTKILAGQEMGIAPMAAMNGFHIVDGQPKLSAGLIGALVKRSGRYDYRVLKSDETGCALEWLQRTDAGAWKVVGESKFTMAQAQKIPTRENGRDIKLSEKSNWKNYGEDMLFARALTRGARRYCPDVFGGAVYAIGEETSDAADRPEYGTEHVGRVDPPRFSKFADPEAVDAEVVDDGEGEAAPQVESLL